MVKVEVEVKVEEGWILFYLGKAGLKCKTWNVFTSKIRYL